MCGCRICLSAQISNATNCHKVFVHYAEHLCVESETMCILSLYANIIRVCNRIRNVLLYRYATTRSALRSKCVLQLRPHATESVFATLSIRNCQHRCRQHTRCNVIMQERQILPLDTVNLHKPLSLYITLFKICCWMLGKATGLCKCLKEATQFQHT